MSDAEQTLPDPNVQGPDASTGLDVPIDPESLARHYEADDVHPGPIAWFVFGLTVLIAIALVLLWWIIGLLADRPIDVRVQIEPAIATPPVVVGPGLDAQPESELGRYLAQESARLNNYGWIDREAGVVRIPIDRAMELLVEKGVPAVEGEIPRFGLDPAFKMDSTGGLRPVGEEDLEDVESDSGMTSDGESGGESGSTTPESEGAGSGTPDEGATEGATPKGGVIDSGATDENVTSDDSTDAGATDGEAGEGGVIDSGATDENVTSDDSTDAGAPDARATDEATDE